MRRLIPTLLALLTLPLVMEAPARALELRSGDRVVISADEIIEDDLYVGAREVRIEGEVRGDVHVAGQLVDIAGTITGDLVAVGQTIDVTGAVGDDARLGGQVVRLGRSSEVGDELLVGAQSLETAPDSTVGGTLAFGGYQALLRGEIGESSRVGAVALRLDGRIEGDLDVQLDPLAGGGGGPAPSSDVAMPALTPGLELGPEAIIAGRLDYRGPTEARVETGASIGQGLQWTEITTPVPGPAQKALDAVQRLTGLLLMGLLLAWVAPRWLQARAAEVGQKPLACLGAGALGIVGSGLAAGVVLLATLLLAAIFGMLTLGGLAALSVGLGALVEGTLAMTFAFCVAFLAQAVVGAFVGRRVLARLAPAAARQVGWATLVGLLLYGLVRVIPIFGPLLAFAATLLGLGAITRDVWARRSLLRPMRPAAGADDASGAVLPPAGLPTGAA